MRAAVYALATRAGPDNPSAQLQPDALAKWAAGNRWHIVAAYDDAAPGEIAFFRPGM